MSSDWNWDDDFSGWEDEVVTKVPDVDEVRVITPTESKRTKNIKQGIVIGGAFLVIGISKKLLDWALDL